MENCVNISERNSEAVYQFKTTISENQHEGESIAMFETDGTQTTIQYLPTNIVYVLYFAMVSVHLIANKRLS